MTAVGGAAGEQEVQIYSLQRDAGDARSGKFEFDASWTGKPIVVDNGSYHCRVGWAGEDAPRLDFRNLVARPRNKGGGEAVSVVGDYDPLELRGHELGRGAVRSAFEQGLVYQYDTQESALDYAFERLSLPGESVDHPLMMTEATLNPSYCRARMTELLVETYGVPSVAYGVDSAFAYTHNRLAGRVGPDGLVFASGHSATHTYPMLGGEPALRLASRLNVAGLHATEHLHGLLSLKYPQHAALMAWGRPLGRPEELKEALTVCAVDYLRDLARIEEADAKGEPEVGGWLRTVQLPWVAAPSAAAAEDPAAAAEAAARRAASKQAAGQRLRDMAAAKRADKVEGLEATLGALYNVLHLVDTSKDEAGAARLCREAGYADRAVLAREVTNTAAALARAKGEPLPEGSEKEEEPTFPLVDVPDEQLRNEEEQQAKKRQRLMKGAYDHRMREKKRKEEDRKRAEEERARDEEERQKDPVGYLAVLREKHAALAVRIEARKLRRLGKGRAADGERRGGAAQKERMRLLAEAAGDEKKEKAGGVGDDFGADDKDWEVYKKMDRHHSDSDEAERDEAEFARASARLGELDPSSASALGGAEAGGAGGLPARRAPRAEDFQVRLAVERIRVPECVWQPSLLGVDQAGAAEIVGVVLARLSQAERGRVLGGQVLLQGGNTLYGGFAGRMAREVAMCCPLGSPMAIVAPASGMLDAWKGAAQVAARAYVAGVTRQQVEELGVDNAVRALREVRYGVGL